MSIRDDVTVDWNASPRIVEVAAPSTEITIQGLVDTLRELEEDLLNLSFPKLLDCSGKEELGGGIKVGITTTLLNAKVKFEARPGPTFVQCSVSGGNLVALDINGDVMSAIEVSDYTQVLLTSSSSATLQELETIQFGSFNNGVWIDPTSTNVDSAYPSGTLLKPVKDFATAKIIAEYRGFNRLYIMGDLISDPDDDFAGYQIIGQSYLITSIALDGNCCNSTIFERITFSGIMDDDSVIVARDCTVGDLTGFCGDVYDSMLSGLLIMNAAGPSNFINCFDGLIGTPTPVFDMTNCPALGIWGFNGGLKVQNLDNAAVSVGVNMYAGRLVVDSSVTAFSAFRVKGVGMVTNNSLLTLDLAGLVNPELISDAVWDDVDAKLLLSLISKQEVYVHNKKGLVKVDSTWHFRIYDEDEINIIKDKELKDKNGNDITDIAAGVLALEMMSTV